MNETLLAAVIVIPVVIVLAFLLVLLRLTGRSDFKFRARGFGVSVNLATEEDAEKELAQVCDPVKCSK